jgi:hypothetical protein
MSSDSPSETKPEAPKSLFDKIGAALPIGLTALATVFAGMSTGALQQAMYWKSQAAQDQSRATNQWSYAGFKRDRALIMQTMAAQLRAISGYASPNLSTSALPPIKVKPDESNVEQKRKELSDAQAKALAWLQKKNVPPSPLPEITDERIIALQKAIDAREPETELLKLAIKIKHHSINETIDNAEKKSKEYDDEWSPIMAAAADIAGYAEGDKADANMRTARQAVGYDLEERRYRAESRLNQGIGYLYEIRVKVSSAESDKHRRKSELFFYAMLAAQIGATISALSLARRTKSVLWLFAAMIGLASIGIGAYVFLEQIPQ